jgi:alpha-L-fucosidase
VGGALAIGWTSSVLAGEPRGKDRQRTLYRTVQPIVTRGDSDDAALEDLMLPDEAQTPRMKTWMNYRYGMFIHFNINTFVGTQQVPKPPPATTYAPRALDVDSWVRLARDAGMKYVVLTTKHSGGFCLWDSKVPWHGKEFNYDVAAGGNTTDVVQAFVDACRKYDIAPGLYYCLADSYANQSAPIPQLFRTRVLPDDAFELAKAQLAELATRYPACRYYWLDGPKTASVAQQGALYDVLRRKNPEIVVLMNHHLAHAARTGNDTLHETGSEAAAFPAYACDILNTESRQRPRGVISQIQKWQGKTLYMGYEHCDTLTQHWFWSKNDRPRPTAELLRLYRQVRAAGGNLLLNVAPDTTGRMPEASIKALMKLKQAIDAATKPEKPESEVEQAK